MTFMDSLAQNPSSGIYGQPGQTSDSDVLSLVNKLKDRDWLDYQNKANFNADLSLRQEARMRSLFPPAASATQNTQGMDTVMARDPNEMTGYEKANIGIRQQDLSLDKQKLAQQGKLGEEALNIKSQQEKLNQQKSDQIKAGKEADMQRKIEEANNKLGLAYDQLNDKSNTAEKTLEAHKAVQAAMEERHKLEIEKKDRQFEESKRLHDAQIKKMEDDAELARKPVTKEIETNPEQTKRVETTTRGQPTELTPKKKSDGSYDIYNGDKYIYTIPGDKLDDWKANHANNVPPK